MDQHNDDTTPFDSSTERALAVIKGHDGPIVVDFDETLYLRNSTSEFLSSAQPALLAYLLIKILDVVKPWRRSGDKDGRDAWRVRTILTFMPWTLRRWKKHAPVAAVKMLNRPLVDGLRDRNGDVVVSTLGFRPIVAPLVANLGLTDVELVAMDPYSATDRHRGKLALTVDNMGSEAVAESAVITDSPSDLELLSACKVPLRVIWPGASRSELFNSLYFPGRYLSRVKRPGSHYIRSKVLREDIALWILGSVWLADNPVAHIAGLLLLAVSFWAVYEMGYVDNDQMAAAHEEDAVLTSQFHRAAVSYPRWKPIVWSLVTGALGIMVLRFNLRASVFDYLRWLVVLLVLLGVYAVYNRLDKKSRIYLFPILQLLRASAFVALVPIAAVAAVAIIVHVTIRWVNYYVYRVGNGAWPAADLSLIRLIVFVAGTVLVVAYDDWPTLLSPVTISLLVWHLFLARRTLPAVMGAAHRVDR